MPTTSARIGSCLTPPKVSSRMCASNAKQFNRTTAGAAINLVADVAADAQALNIDGANADVNAFAAVDPATPSTWVLTEIGGTTGEYRFVTAISGITPSSATNLTA